MEWSLHCIKPLDMSTDSQHPAQKRRNPTIFCAKPSGSWHIRFPSTFVESWKPESLAHLTYNELKDREATASEECTKTEGGKQVASALKIAQEYHTTCCWQSNKITIQRSAGKVNMTAIQRPAFCSIRLPWPSQISMGKNDTETERLVLW